MALLHVGIVRRKTKKSAPQSAWRGAHVYMYMLYIVVCIRLYDCYWFHVTAEHLSVTPNSRRLADRGTRDALPERERRCAHGATRPMERVVTRSVEIRERERRRPASSDRYDLVTVRFTLSADCLAFRELFGFWADFRSVRLWAGRWLAARGAAELFVVCLFRCGGSEAGRVAGGGRSLSQQGAGCCRSRLSARWKRC